MGTNRSEVPQGPITLVPSDILLEIFDACRIVHEDDNEHTSSIHGLSVRAGPPAVAAVCQSWRDLVVHTPTLWTDVHIKLLSKNLTSAMRLLDVILARSAELPLSISMRSFDRPSVAPDAAGPLINALLEQSARWSRLDVRASERIFHLLLPAQGRLPQLRSLRSRILYKMTTRLNWAPLRGLFSDCPALVDVEHWGPKLDFPWEQLVRLSLKGQPPSDALERTTRARVLHLMEEPIEVSSYDEHLWVNVLHLERPNLEKLSVKEVERLRCVRAPNLTECHFLKDISFPEDLRAVTNYVLAESLRLTTLSLSVIPSLATELRELLAHCPALCHLQLQLAPISWEPTYTVQLNTAEFSGALSLLVVHQEHPVLLPALRHLHLMMNYVLSADAFASLADIIQSRAAAPDDIATSLQSLVLHIRTGYRVDLMDGISDLEVQLQSCRVEGIPVVSLHEELMNDNLTSLDRIWREEWTVL
ncbi:hypothetical protein EV714DRAFT_277476 [Schizophyllum commune]